MKKLGTVGFALGVGLLAASASAQSQMSAPPWGEEGGPKIVFGVGDKGVMQFDYKGAFRMTADDTGSGPSGTDGGTSFAFWRNRVSLRGGWGEKVSLYVNADFTENQNQDVANSSSNFQLLDAVVRFNLHDSFKINIGKFKYNLSRENLEMCEEPLTLDRSTLIRASYVGTRDNGVAVWGNFLKDRLQYRVDAMEGRHAVTGQVMPASKFRYSARGHVTLLDPENTYGYKGTYLGEKKVLTFGGAYQIEPKAVYTDTVMLLDPKDYKAWTADVFFEYPIEGFGTPTLSGAYQKIDMGGAYQGANPDPGSMGWYGERNGWYGKAGYLLPHTKLQVFGRFEKWRYASLNGVYDELVDWYGGGANYYVWGQSLKISAEYHHTRFDKKSSPDLNTFVTQLQLVF